MRRILWRAIPAVAFLVSLLVAALGAPRPAGAVPIDMQPRTDGKTVVWVGPSDYEGFTVIVVQSVGGASRSTIGSGLDYLTWPDVSGHFVVWIETPPSDTGTRVSSIRGKNLQTGATFDVSTNLGAGIPSISGTRVVWLSGNTIWMRDLATMAAPITLATVSNASSPNSSFLRPFISGDLVAWGEGWRDSANQGQWRLWGEHIGSAPFVVAHGSGPGEPTDYDVGGSRVVYRVDDKVNTQIHVVDLATPGNDRVIATEGDKATDVENLTTDGRYVFWGIFGLNHGTGYQIHGYDAQTDSDIAAPEGFDQNIEPSARAGVLAWRSGEEITAMPIHDFLPSAPQPNPGKTDPNWTYYPQTGHYLAYGFRTFWQQSGGLPVFGYPRTEEFEQHGLTVQYVERQRFEYHPEFKGTPYETELGRLGYEDAQARGLLSSAAFTPRAPGSQPSPGCLSFSETGHQVCGAFLAYWQSHGLSLGDPGISFRESVALFGYPISENFVDPATGLQTQYFERAVFEWHPGSSAPYHVELRRLGAQQLQQAGW